MSKDRFLAGTLSAVLMLPGSAALGAQDFPIKPVRIVTSGVGGGTDIVARLMAPGLTENLGQQVIVENRGSSIVPGEIVSKSQPDGHTVFFGASGLLWLLPFLHDKLPFDPVKDFAPVSLVGSFPTVLVVNPSVPAKSVNELIAYGKAKPGALNYMITVAGGSAHLAAELFTSMAGIQVVRVPYKNAGTGLVDLLGGRVQMWFSAAGAVTPHMKTGKLRALAVTSPKPFVLLPDVPTVAASLPGYDYVSIYGMFAPARTPAAVINRLNREIVKVVIENKDIREKFLAAGVEPVAGSPEVMAAARKAEMTRLGKVIKDAGIRAD
jgi:tripartite-type tricarboxylate transporter receptor subunit TctC